MRTWFINGLAQQQLWPETSVDQPNRCFLEPIVDHHNMSSLWEKETQPSLPVSSTKCVSEEHWKAPVNTTDGGKGTASIPTTSYRVAMETKEVKKALADIPLDVTSKKKKQKQGRVKSPPETSVDHTKGSSCLEPSGGRPKGSSFPELTMVQPYSSCPEPTMVQPCSSFPEPIVVQPYSLPMSHTPSVSEAQRKASVDITDNGKG
ncbi:unnamed protein product [Boreogadus saida]